MLRLCYYQLSTQNIVYNIGGVVDDLKKLFENAVLYRAAFLQNRKKHHIAKHCVNVSKFFASVIFYILKRSYNKVT